MDPNSPVPLTRRFSPVPRTEDDSIEQQAYATLGYSSFRDWSAIDKGYRSVILAEAGAGKTFEMRSRAQFVEAQGHPAFYMRIEDICPGFEHAFEVGSLESFERWLYSQADAWFFLDSVDEARLNDPRDFERAIRHFSSRITNAQLRAHVCISSRPYAWRPHSDAQIIDHLLPYNKPPAEITTDNSTPAETTRRPDSALEIYYLCPLGEDEIRIFAAHHSTPEVDQLINELERLNLMDIAARPFDLLAILGKWFSDQTLDGRRELLRNNIVQALKEFHPDRARRQSLSLERARDGARALAAAVILTGEPGIRIPDHSHEKRGIDAESVLGGWSPDDVHTLLERAIFNDVIYGSVRFRHREVGELLAAEWFSDLLQKGHSRNAIESLFFRTQYDEKIIAPRLRPILAWLILDDERIRERTLRLCPEVAVEGGDPAQLPFPDRKRILRKIVERIVQREDTGAAGDNSAIARIAQRDLTEVTLELINRHCDDEDAIFFLGRLVWQGNMSKCVSALLSIGGDPALGIYARIAATRAIMTCGTDDQRMTFWDSLLDAQQDIPTELVAELVQNAPARSVVVGMLLKSIDKLAPRERSGAIRLTRGIHNLIDRLPLSAGANENQSLALLVSGVYSFLDRSPYVERHQCRLSKEFAWLLDPAIHAVERLVSARADAVTQSHATAILLNGATIREYLGVNFDHYKDSLSELVPSWPALNDALFWRSVGRARIRLDEDGKRLTDDWHVQWPAHYWSFGPDSFSRVLSWINDRELEDDRLVALSLAVRICSAVENSSKRLDRLHTTVRDDAVLERHLDKLLNPTLSEQDRVWQDQWKQQKRDRARQRREKEKDKLDWISQLKADPERIRNPPGLAPNSFSTDHYWLLTEYASHGTNGRPGTNWKSLIDEFGKDVAIAYRDAAMSYWRHHQPGLRSEGTDTSRIPYSLNFALAGLEIEAQEAQDFPRHLHENEIHHALRYITSEASGVPGWLEAMYRTQPREVMKAIETELLWELENTKPDEPLHYILHALTYYAPWLHSALVDLLLPWILERDFPSADTQRCGLHILKSGGVNPLVLATIAKAKVDVQGSTTHRSYWYAIWVDAEPDTGVPAVAAWLEGLGHSRSSDAAQLFITALMGTRDGANTGPNIGNFRTARHLKDLYVLMHEHIPATEDVRRPSGRVYSPEMRDHAQNARSALFNSLSRIPGKEAYIAVTELIQEHPDPNRRSRMAKLAYHRAEQDGDLEPWTPEQVSEFGSRLTRTPSTHRQLFDLTVDRLNDLKHWIERGNDSPYRTWRKAENENEIRNLVAGSLNQQWNNHYTTAQEPEIANKQRMDIWLQNQAVPHPVVVEIKLLDKGWSGPELCERLRNQLAGDYLREGTARSGLMLLIWKGRKPQRRWRIGGRLVGISGIRNVLKRHWANISNRFPNIEAIEIVVIDLTCRDTLSDE